MNSTEFQNLVERYISERCTPEEIVRLRELLKDSGYDAELSKIMDEQLANNTAAANDYPGLTDRLKKSIEQKIAEEQESSVVRRLSFFRRWTAAAAIILILLGAGTFFWIINRATQQHVLVVKQKPLNIDVAPGKQGAILTLVDGTKVVLDSLGNGVIADQNGSKVSLNNGQLTYNADGSANVAVAYNTMTTPKGRQFQLVLPDGSKVWLNAASSIRYPTVFTGKERKVEITGEAYFEVAKNAAMPFRVKVNDEAEIQVLGTHFNINSYTNEESVNTTLLEGSVQIFNGNEKAILKPGQQGQVAANSPIKVLNDVDVDKVMAWKNGVFDFQDVSLKEVMRQLERWYDIEVVYEKGVPDIEFVGTMGRDLSLSDVLSGLKLSEVHCRIEEGRRLIVMP